MKQKVKNMMANVTEKYADFFSEITNEYPEVAKTNQVSRKQILDWLDSSKSKVSVPWGYLLNNKVKKGLYSIPGGNISTAPNSVSESTAPVVVDSLDPSSLIPKRDTNYVPFGNYRDLEVILTSKMFYPVYVSGPTGNGKSTTIEQICAKHKRPLIRVNLNTMTDEDQLIGSKTLVDGNVQVVEGPVVLAMRMGIPLLLDEIDAGGANTLLCLQPILEGKPFYFKLKNEMIVPATGFNIFATANTKGKGSDDGRYIGTNVLNEAFLERFAVTFNQDYPSANIEKKIVVNLMNHYGCVNLEYAETLVKWADVIRKTFDAGGVDETITTRRLVHIVRAFSIFKDQAKAIELCTNRFDDATRLAFIDLFDKVSNGEEGTDVSTDTSAPAETVETQEQPVV
jgi:MoxR-like ATPase